MSPDHPLSVLLIVTFAAVLLIGVVLLLRFLRKPRNRHPMAGQPERTGEQINREGPEQ